MHNTIMRREINLDHAATTRPDPAVIRAVCVCMEQCDANPSAPYAAAGTARREIRLAKETLSRMIGCDRTEIVFTSGGTEANNLALRQGAGRHVVLSAIEHKSVLEAAKLQGCKVTLVNPEPSGRIDPAQIQAAIRPDTALISVQFANNETGVLQPVAEIGAMARRHRILYHCDAVQAFGHVPIDVVVSNIDLLSASAHKLYGPRGVGFLYVRQGMLAQPLMAGGGQEGGLRAGTENVPAIAGFHVAAELAEADMIPRGERLRQLVNEFVLRLKEKNPVITEIAGDAHRLPGICALHLPGILSEIAIAWLDQREIRISGGAACGSVESGPSHVLRAMGIPEEQANEVIRTSPGRHTTEAEMILAADAISAII